MSNGFPCSGLPPWHRSDCPIWSACCTSVKSQRIETTASGFEIRSHVVESVGCCPSTVRHHMRYRSIVVDGLV